MGCGLAIAYRSSLYTIGAEGQYVIGAVAATAWATAGGVRDLPSPLLIIGCLVSGAIAGSAWSCISAALNTRFGTNIVISSLLLTYVGLAIMQWAIRVGIRDPESFIPASRMIGDAALPVVPGLNTHLGFVIALVVVPVLTVVMSRTRFGYRVDVLGHNPNALGANEVRESRVMFGVLGLVGALSGIAGYIQVAGVTQRINAEFSVGYGYTAILVALLGRMNLVGVLLAGLGLSGLTIGLDVAERTYDLPSSLTGLLQASGGRDVDAVLSIDTLAAGLRLALPVALAALGALLCERSGVLNLGLEGLMLCGALAGYLVTDSTGSPWVGLFAGLVIGGLCGALLGGAVVYLAANQVVAGLAFSLIAVSATTYVYEGSYDSGQSPPRIERISMPPLVIVTLVVFGIVVVLLRSTLSGLVLTATGESPVAVDALGYSVQRTRFFTTIGGSALAGLGGAVL
eukprot:gene17078-35366_t